MLIRFFFFFFSLHNFKERRGVDEVRSDLAETIYTRIIIRNTADTFRMNSIIGFLR